MAAADPERKHQMTEMADVGRLRVEISELKQLMLCLLAQQNTQQMHPQALAVSQQQQELPQLALSAIEQQLGHALPSKHTTADGTMAEPQQDMTRAHAAVLASESTKSVAPSDAQYIVNPKRPKPRVHLELPSDENAAVPLQPQLQEAVPQVQTQGMPATTSLLQPSKLFKPSISDAVLRWRAAQQTQVSNTTTSAGVAKDVDAGLAPHAAVQQEHRHKRHVSESALASTHTSTQQFLQTIDGADEWTVGAGYGDGGATVKAIPATGAEYNDIDLLSKRVHSVMVSRDGSQELQDNSADPKVPLPWYKEAAHAALEGVKAFFWDVLVPQGLVLVGWDMLMLLLIIYMCFVLPYAVAFGSDFGDLSQPLAVIDLIINLLFLVDVWTNFHTSFIDDDGQLVTDRRRIAITYMKGWLAFDLLTSIPYEQMLAAGMRLDSALVRLVQVARVVRILKVLRLIKLLRLARVLQLPHVMQFLEAVVGRVLLQLSTMAGSMVLLLHWAACIWYYVAVVQDDGKNWVKYGDLQGASYTEIYVTALYWSVTTIATVGYGDVVGHSVREKIVAMVAMLIGASVFGYFMGAMAVVVSALNSNSARIATKRQAVDNFLKHRRVPKLLAGKVRNYYNYVVEREVQADEADIIAGLSASLRTQVVLHLYQEALEKVPFFRGQDPQFITSVVTFLKLEYYAPGDIVVRQGDLGSEMYFIGEGILEARIYQDERGSPLHKATYMRSMTRQHKRAGSITQSRRQSAGAGKTQRDSMETTASDSSFTLLRSESSFSRLSIAVQQATDSAMRVARSSRLGKRLLRKSDSSDVGGGSLNRPIGVSDGELEPPTPRTNGRKGSHTGSITSPSGHHDGKKRHSTLLEEPAPHQRPLRTKKMFDKYMFIDELGHRPYRCIGYLRPGEYFGEYTCLLGEARTATVVATTYCELYSLSRADLEEVLQQWPELAEEFEAMVHSNSAARQPAPAQASAHGPLAMWSMVKAAYQQKPLSRSDSPADFSRQPAAPPPAAQPQQQQQGSTADGLASEGMTESRSAAMSAAEGGQSPMTANGEASVDGQVNVSFTIHEQLGSWTGGNRDPELMYERQTSSSARRGSTVADLNPQRGTVGHRLCEPRTSLGRMLSYAAGGAVQAPGPSHSSSDGTEHEPGMSVAARTAASIRRSLYLDRPQQVQQQPWRQDQMQQWEQCTNLSEGRVWLDDASLSGVDAAATVSACAAPGQPQRVSDTQPSLSRNSNLGRQSRPLSRQSAGLAHTSANMSCGSPVGLARSSGSLSRRSPLELRRSSSFIPGVGTGLFQSNAGGYLFPASVDRSGALVVQSSARSASGEEQVMNNYRISSPSLQRRSNPVYDEATATEVAECWDDPAGPVQGSQETGTALHSPPRSSARMVAPVPAAGPAVGPEESQRPTDQTDALQE